MNAHHHRLSAPPRRTSSLSLSNDDNLAELDEDLAREIEEALLLANDAISAQVYETEEDEIYDEEVDEEAEIAEIAAALTSAPSPPKMPEINVAPPEQEPTLFGSVLSDQVELDDDVSSPLPPMDPPTVNAVSFGEALSKAVTDEIDRLKNLLFGLKEDLKETESNAVKAESTAEALKREIEESRQQRESVMKEIESQFAKEKKLLMEQLGSASTELQEAIDQSTEEIARAQSEASEAEKQLVARMDEFTASIKQFTEETVKVNMEKEQLLNSKQEKIDAVKRENSDNLAKYKATLSEEGEGVKLYNLKLQKRANEAEQKVRDIYDSVKKLREDRISLQQQIEDVERESLDQIATLEQQILEDDEEYTSYLAGERARIDKLITDAKAKYASILEKERAKRESIESDFEAELAQKDAEGKASIAAIESKAKSKLDNLEKQHSAERIAIYQEKVEAVNAVRNEMLAQLAIEEEKLTSIHEEMQAKIESVKEEIAEVKAVFEQELAERRQVAEAEKTMFLNRMEDIKADMEDKINTQRKIMETEKFEYLKEQNLLINDSEEECRRAWVELATLNQKVGEAGKKRNDLIGEIKEKSDLIALYESDRASFRKSLKLSFKVAREKIGNGTRRVLGREKETSQ